MDGITDAMGIPLNITEEEHGVGMIFLLLFLLGCMSGTDATLSLSHEKGAAYRMSQ